MTWFKVDDSFYDHPKAIELPDCAIALWTRAGAWSARYHTNGFVPTAMTPRLCNDPERATEELLASGLWDRSKDGYTFHDWATYQPSGGAMQKRSSGGVLGNHLRWHTAPGKRKETCPHCAGEMFAERSLNGSLNRSPTESLTNRLATPSPARPVVGAGVSGLLTPRARNGAPPLKCKEHENQENPPPCGQCAEARRVYVRWQKAEIERERNMPRCRRHRGQPAHNCSLCRSELLASTEDYA